MQTAEQSLPPFLVIGRRIVSVGNFLTKLNKFEKHQSELNLYKKQMKFVTNEYHVKSISKF